MKTYHTSTKWLLLLLMGYLGAALVSCNIQKAIDGIDLSKPVNSAKIPANELASGVGKNLMNGIDSNSKKTIDDILKEVNIDKLNPDIQKLLVAITTIGDTTSLQITKVGDNVHWQIGRLNGDVALMGKTVRGITDSIKNGTKDLLTNIIQNALNSLQTPQSKTKIDSIVANLLDKNTRQKAQLLVSSAIQPTIDSLANKIHATVQNDLPFMQKQAVGLLLAIGIIALGIIAFVWYERSKYARLVKILTFQIDKMPEEHRAAYDDLTKSIKANAQSQDLQPLLSKILIKQGIN
jgi:hypothetical protein